HLAEQAILQAAREVQVEQGRLRRRQGELAEERGARLPAGARAQQSKTEAPRLAVVAEALRAVEVGQPVAAQSLSDRREALGRLRVDIADDYTESIAVEVSRLELVGVAVDVQQPEAVALKLVQQRLGGGGNGHHLPRERVPVLEPRGADLARR